jgi:hypothetical protein
LTGPEVAFLVESMLYHCTVEDDLFAVTTETKLEVCEAEVSAPTLHKSWTLPDSMMSGLNNLYGTLKVPVGFFKMNGHFLQPHEEFVSATPSRGLAEEGVVCSSDTADGATAIVAKEEAASPVTAEERKGPDEQANPQLVVELQRFARKWSLTKDGSEFLRRDCTEVASIPLQLEE